MLCCWYWVTGCHRKPSQKTFPTKLVVELVFWAALAMPGTGEGRCSAGSLGPHFFIFFSSSFHILFIIIELDDGNIYRKTLYLMVKTMVSCRFSLKPTQWHQAFSSLFQMFSREIPRVNGSWGSQDPMITMLPGLAESTTWNPEQYHKGTAFRLQRRHFHG